MYLDVIGTDINGRIWIAPRGNKLEDADTVIALSVYSAMGAASAWLFRISEQGGRLWEKSIKPRELRLSVCLSVCLCVGLSKACQKNLSDVGGCNCFCLRSTAHVLSANRFFPHFSSALRGGKEGRK
jgi:hypothetical protein